MERPVFCVSAERRGGVGSQTMPCCTRAWGESKRQREREREREREMVGWVGPLQVTTDPYFLLNNLFLDDAAICVRLNQLMTS